MSEHDPETPSALVGQAPAGPVGLSRDVGLHMVLAALEIDESPATVGRFQVREQLGRGGMGTVFRAFDPELQRDVALKVLDGKIDDAGADAVREEARALARLAHPNVVAVYELGIERDQVFLAMEYVPGATLREQMHIAPPDTRTLVDWFVQAGRGLAAAHQAGLVHRDIKPDNLLVSEDGRIRVADFGLACLAESAPTGQIAGTPTFMAPEVTRDGLASTASDQYAFCASLWRLLDAHSPLGSAMADIPIGLRDALTRGLADHPDDRWPSMDALLDALVPPPTTSPEAHQRSVLLQRVERLWIQGVLRASLADGPVFEVPLSESPIHVDAPFPPLDSRHGPPTTPPGAGQTDLTALPGLLEEGQGAMLVLGEPGGGKTITLLRLAESLLDEARLDPRAPAPVVLKLGSLANHRGPVEAWIEQELVAKYGLPRRPVRRWLAEGSLVLLLDGLDEIARADRARCVDALNRFRAEHGLPMAVTCRTSDYDSLPVRLGFGQAIVVDPLPDAAVSRVWARLGLPTTDVEPDVGFVRSPLMLGLLARSDAPADPADRKTTLPWLYSRYLQHQIDAHGVSDEEGEALLGTLGFLAHALGRAERTELWLEQLAPEWVFEPGRRLAAQSLAVSMLVAFCVVTNASVGFLVEGDAFSGLVFGLVSVPMILVFNGGLAIQPVERLRFSFGRLARMLPLALGLGVVFGAVYGYFYILWVNVFFGAVAGLVTTVTVAFEPSLQESNIRPNQGMRQSLANGLGIGVLGLVLGASVFGLVAVPLVLPHLDASSTLVGSPHPARSGAAVAGLLLGVIAGMVRGGWAVLQHIAVRLVLAASTPVPLAVVPLLDRAVDLGLLRRVGGGYLFLHRTFQDFLAARYS